MTILRVGDCFPHNTEQPFNSLPFLISFLAISIIAYISWSWAISDHLVKLVLLLGARTTSTNRHSSFIVWGIWGAPNFGPGHTHLWVNTVRPNSGEICQTCPFPLVVRNTLMLITTWGVSWNRRHPNQSLSLQKHQKKQCFGLCLDHHLGSAVQEKHGLRMVLASCLPSSKLT